MSEMEAIVKPEIRTYFEGEWAVRRWDRVNAGRAIQPKSFCQFWRTVLVWATLQMVLPFLFTSKPSQPAEIKEFNVPKPVAFAGRATGGVLWAMLWPLRAVIAPIWRGVGSSVEWLREHESVANAIGMIFIAVIVAAGLAVIGASTYRCVTNWLWPVAIPWLIALGLDGWGRVAVSVAVAIVLTPVSGLVVFFVGKALVKSLLTVGEVAIEGGKLAGEIAVQNKKRVCPPMTIRRRPTAR